MSPFSYSPRPAPSPSQGPDDPPPSRSSRLTYRVLGAVVLITVVCSLLLARAGHIDTAAQDFLTQFTQSPIPAPASDPDTLRPIPAPTFQPGELPTHPDVVHRDYMNPSVVENNADSSSLVFQFRELLALYEKRQGVDDNFTLRVFDNRTGAVLEVYTMEQERTAYRRGASMEWEAIDRKRRRLTRDLVDKYEARGIPNEAISVKWGRANQVQEAHQNDAPYVEYEMRLARHLDLSLLPIEIGTVETFNQDHLVSSVGARSRYQMMPFILRRNGLHRYWLRTTSGRSVRVRDERHPLLTMEPAFLLLRGYVNAVGHEIPGISAYHTGPGNIYKLYRLFLTESDGRFRPSADVMDAYMWAVTEGYDYVSERSTFGPYSRGYVASAYGALRATDRQTVDTTKTLRAARVQLTPRASASLSQLLDTLQAANAPLDWGTGTDGLSLYERFRSMNPHFDLPPGRDGAVPPSGDVKLVSAVGGKAVHFFLPLGAPAVLAQSGLDVIDEDATFRFDTNTFAPPTPAERTKWDRAYDDLVQDIKQFGFTERNRNRLLVLHEEFERLAEADPSRYRQNQLRVLETHRRIWLSNPWEELSDATTIAMGRVTMPVQPPIALETSPAPLRVPSATAQ